MTVSLHSFLTAPDFHSMHHVIPDVWSYPSLFQTSNPRRNIQIEETKLLNGRKDVFVDLGRAPPRFQESIISEESNEEQAESVLDQDSIGDTDEAHRQIFYLPDLVMTQVDEDLLEEASSFLKCTTEEADMVNRETSNYTSKHEEADIEDEELIASLKRLPASSVNSGEEEVGGIKIAKTAVADSLQEEQADLISELASAEDIYQREESGVAVFDERVSEEDVWKEDSVTSVSTIDENDIWLVVSVNEPKNNTNVVEDQKGVGFASETPSQLSFKNGCSESKHEKEESGTACFVNSGMFGHPSPEHSITVVYGKTSLLDEGRCDSQQTFPYERANLCLALQQDPFMGTDPFLDHNPTPSPSGLGFDESKFDNSGIDLMDFVEGETALEGSDDEASLSSTPEKCEQDDEIDDGNQSEELRLIASSNFTGDTINTPDCDDCGDVVGSHMVSLDFVESSDADTASEMSEEDEPLWSTFPEYFQPSRRLEYSGKNQGVLLLAEEGQDDVESLNSTETEQGVALVSLKEFHSKDVNLLGTSLIENEVFVDKHLEELSTASSDSFEYTYEVNTEFESEDEIVIANDDHDSLKEKKGESNQEIREYQDITNELPLFISFASSNTCFKDKHDNLLDARSSRNGKGLKVDELKLPFSTENTVSSSPYDETGFYEKAQITEIHHEKQRKKPSTSLELSCRNYGSDGPCLSFEDSFKHSSDEKEILLQGFRSLSHSMLEINPSLKDQDRRYSPTEWIVPSPPTPTPELQEDEIRIVSPPPIYPALSEGELDEELKHLIVPPPPSLADTMQTSIKIVSPPPPAVPVDMNHNEIDVLMYHFDEIRFLSLTDDHKLARNNGLMPKQNPNSNFTEDKKIQVQKVMRDASSMSKDKISVSKHVSFQPKHNYILNTWEAYPTETKVEQRCKRHVPGSHFPGGSEDSINTSQSPEKHKSVLEDSVNSDNPPSLDSVDADKDENVTSSRASEQIPLISNARQEKVSFGSGSKIAVKQKPPIPPKPRLSQAAENEGIAKVRNVVPTKVIEFSSNKNVPIEEGFSTELAEPGMSMSGFEPRKENVLKDSNNRPASLAANTSQVGAPKKYFTEVLEPAICEKMNSTNVEIEPSEVAFMKLSSELSTENTCGNSGQKTSAKPVAFRPVIPSVNKEQTLATSQLEQSPSTSVKDIINTYEVNTQYYSRGLGRRFSFTYTSAYVPVPYSPIPSPTQSRYPSQSSVQNVHDSSLRHNRLSPVKPPVTDSTGERSRLPCVKPRSATSPVTVASSSSTTNSVSLPGTEEFRILRRPPLKRIPATLPESNGDRAINLCKVDSNRVLSTSSLETSDYQFPTYLPIFNAENKNCSHTVEPHKDFGNDIFPSISPPPLDSSPPPLPPTSPPNIIPKFDDDDFDFGEPLADIGQDCPQIDSWEPSTFEIPSSAEDLKSRRSSVSFCHKRGNSCDNIHTTQTKFRDSYFLSRSPTLTSSSRDINRRSFSDASHSYVGAFQAKRPSLPLQLGTSCKPDNVTDEDSLYFETKYLETKCSEVCEESLSKVGGFKKRLEAHLGKSARRAKLPNETKNWPLVLQHNARFLACDVKVISSSTKRGRAQVVAAIRASLDSLEKLVESCEYATAIPNESSTDNVSALVSMVIEVLEHYAGVITAVKATTAEQLDYSDLESLSDKTSAMATLIVTLIRTLRKY